MNNMKKIRELSEQYALRQIELRRQIHTHPELGGRNLKPGRLLKMNCDPWESKCGGDMPRLAW